MLQQCRTLFPSHLPKNEIRQNEGFLEKLIVAKSQLPCFCATNGTKSPITPLTFAPFIFIAIVTILKKFTGKTYKFINIRRLENSILPAVYLHWTTTTTFCVIFFGFSDFFWRVHVSPLQRLNDRRTYEINLNGFRQIWGV